MAKLSDDKREAILAAAIRMFSEHGYSKVTMADIAEGAPVSKPTLYNYFADKQALFGAVVEHQCRTLLGGLSAAKRRKQDPREELTRLAGSFVEVLYDPASVRLFRLVISEQAAFPELGQMVVASGAEPVLGSVAAALREMNEEHTLGIEDAAQSARLLLGMLSGDEHLRCLAGVKPGLSRAEKKRLVQNAVEFFLRAHAVAT
jgi:TetR/AcrR family transcriptional repressor of mexJK operon